LTFPAISLRNYRYLENSGTGKGNKLSPKPPVIGLSLGRGVARAFLRSSSIRHYSDQALAHADRQWIRVSPILVLKEQKMHNNLLRLWQEDEAQDIAEYAVMLAVILVIVVGTIRLIGGSANNVFSSVASSISQ
jgi:Flp pilus assembly pilin Flp